jgi:hypothetical protein
MTEAERLEKYVGFNQLTRHQLVVAHITLIDELQHARRRLAKGLDEYEHETLDALITFALEDLKKEE